MDRIENRGAPTAVSAANCRRVQASRRIWTAVVAAGVISLWFGGPALAESPADDARLEDVCTHIVALIEAEGAPPGSVSVADCVTSAPAELAGCNDVDAALSCAVEATDLDGVDACFRARCSDAEDVDADPRAVAACLNMVAVMERDLGEAFDAERHTMAACLDQTNLIFAGCAEPEKALKCMADAADSEAMTACMAVCDEPEPPTPGADVDPALVKACTHVVAVVSGETGQRLDPEACWQGLADDLEACDDPSVLLTCLGAASDIDGLAACERACNAGQTSDGVDP